jgi:sugar phosphate permease
LGRNIPVKPETSNANALEPRANRHERALALALSWLAYASYYLGRKGFSVVKSALAREHGLSDVNLAFIDTGYLFAYACGQVPSGILADRWGARRVLVFGLLLSAAACVLFAASDSVGAWAIFFTLNGLAQATGWPGTTKVVADWTNPSTRGRVMGTWSTCYQVGGIAATGLATWLLAHFGWRAVFRGPALWLAIMAGLVLCFLRHRQQPQQSRSERAALNVRSQLRAVLRTPVLYSYGACYFCIKLIRYSLLFWLPYYLHTSAGFDEIASGYLSTAFEIGGVLGSVGIGYASDRTPHARARVASLSLLGLAAALLWYGGAGSQPAVWHFVALASVGALLFGPDALISGAAAQDAADEASAATAVGLVNGLGSLGALLQGALTVGLQHALGWNGLFHVFVGLSLVAAACLWPGMRARPGVPRSTL